MAIDPNVEYSKTQRVVLLLDLNPILHLRDPSPYLTTLLSAAKILLSFAPLSSSLFSFKLFFSSLSPLLSSSKLSLLSLFSPSLSFDLPDPTLLSLTRTVQTLATSGLGSHFDAAPSRCFHVAASMRQLVHDYAWDLVVRDPVIGTVLGVSGDDSAYVRSNLVVMFSPLVGDLRMLAEFLDLEINDDCSLDPDMFKLKTGELFRGVDELFSKRDIHVTWIDVKYESGSSCEMSELTSTLKPRVFESGIRGLGWGFCSTDSIILGSAVVPFGLIYPAISVSPHFLSSDRVCGKFHVQTTLELLDVNEKPLECKCSELELVELRIFPGKSHNDVMNLQSPEGITKINIKAVRVLYDTVKLGGCIYKTFILRESSRESGQDQDEGISDFYAHRVLQILGRETGEFVMNKTVPIWQILLTYLYKEGYSALVSLSHQNESSYVGTLRPLTFSSAILSVIDNESWSIVQESYGLKPESMIKKPMTEMNQTDACMSQSSTAVNSRSIPSTHSENSFTNKKTSTRENWQWLQDLTWSTFVQSALNCKAVSLEDAYFAKFKSLKKLKFLKCWMKQIRKSRGYSLTITESLERPQEIRSKTDERVDKFSKERDQMSPFTSEEENSFPKVLATQETDELVSDSEPLDSFFSILPNKVQQGLESEEVDGRALAERLVNMCIYYLPKKLEKENELKGESSLANFEDSYNTRVVEELTKLLLKQPKKLLATHKKDDSLLKASYSASSEDLSNIIVRECELQIFFRMEILGSEAGLVIEESTKQKFVKQICLYLEAIQHRLDGGFFGDWSLDKYVAKIIKSRYYHTLGDIVNRIYAKMDLLLISEENESTNSHFNSEDSNQSGREKQGAKSPISANEKALQIANTEKENLKGRGDYDPRRLLEAQERRERARRFASFTSWMPDLHRVWAPKQLKTGKSKSDPTPRPSKRKERQGAGCDMVCETPLTDYKRSCGSDHKMRGTQSGGSVPKALFQDDTGQWTS